MDVLANNPFYTKRFAHYVGRRCGSTTIKELAKALHLDWDTVKILEKQYMRAQLAKPGHARPQGDRHGRDLGSQRPYLSDRGE